MKSVQQFCNDFLAGQVACQKGHQCPKDATDAFKRGYGAEYEKEQVMSELARRYEDGISSSRYRGR